MFLEVLRMKSKSVDLSSIRAKHKIDEDSEELLENTELSHDIHQFEEIPQIDKPETPPIQPTRVSSRVTKIPSALKTSLSLIKVEKQNQSIKISQLSPVKILNPTIRPKIVSNTPMNLFRCDACSHTCSTKSSLERHMKQIHLKSSSNSFACPHCLKTFAKKVVLQNHLKTHDENRTACSCPQCGKALSSQTAVANHIRWIHNEQREFKCGSCGKMFATVRWNLSCFHNFSNQLFYPHSERITEGA